MKIIKIVKKYATFSRSPGSSKATIPAASKGPTTIIAKKSIITNKLPIRNIGRSCEAFVFLFISPEERKVPIYDYCQMLHGYSEISIAEFTVIVIF